MEDGRRWQADWRGLAVQVQKCIRWRKTWRHRHHFRDTVTLFFPYDTVSRLGRAHPDVIVSAELGLRTLQAVLYCAFHRTRLVVWATVSEVTEADRGRLRLWLRKRLLRTADAIIVNGASGSRYVRHLGAPSERVFLVPQTTDLQPFLNLPRSRTARKSKRILYSGQLIERKGILPFLTQLSKWAAHHPFEEAEFWLVGEGPLRPELERFPSPENLRLRFLGHVPYEDLPAIYAQADLFVFPSLADEWGLAVIEAMAAGLPVLGSLHSQAVEDMIKHGHNGWHFRANCSEELGPLLDQVLAMSLDQLQHIGTLARDTVRPFTPARMADGIARAIRYAQTHAH
jgi:hypothetical protein